LRDFLPEELIDAHAHLWPARLLRRDEVPGVASWPRRVADECTAEGLMADYAAMLPGKRVVPVVMGHPLAGLEAVNGYVLEGAARIGAPALLCTAPGDGPGMVDDALGAGFAGIKPYPSHAPGHIPVGEVRILDFLPHGHLRVANGRGAAVVLHLPRPGRLRDPENLAQLMEIDRLYPDAKVIVAHIGRAYVPSDLVGAFEVLGKSRNLLFDISANTLDAAMVACLEAVGPERVLYGSDMPIARMRMRRVGEGGAYVNLVPKGLYGDVSGDASMREVEGEPLTTFLYETLLAFRRAAERLGLSRSEVGAVFHGNAARIFGLGA